MREFGRKLFRYLFTGGITAAQDVAVFALLIAVHVPTLPASVISFVLAAAANYLLASRFVFKRDWSPRGFLLFLSVAVLGLTANTSVTVFCVDVLALPPVLGKIAGVGVAFVINFTLNMFFVFRHPRRGPEPPPP